MSDAEYDQDDAEYEAYRYTEQDHFDRLSWTLHGVETMISAIELLAIGGTKQSASTMTPQQIMEECTASLGIFDSELANAERDGGLTDEHIRSLKARRETIRKLLDQVQP